MCIGSLRSMLLRCFAQLSSLKRWVSAWYLRLGSSVYTQVRKALRFLLCFSFLLFYSLASGISPVLAQDTPTPPPSYVNTPTPESLFKTPTTAPTKNLTCNGQPLGWGTVTPDAYWASNCALCVTPIPLGNWPTLQSTNTPVGYTPQPTQAPTITPTALSSGDSDLVHFSVEDWNYTGYLYYSGQTMEVNTPLETGIPYGARRDFKMLFMNEGLNDKWLKVKIDTTLKVGLSCGGTMRLYFNNTWDYPLELKFNDAYGTETVVVTAHSEVLIKTWVFNSGYTGDLLRSVEVKVENPNKIFPPVVEDFNFRWWYQLGCANSTYQVKNTITLLGTAEPTPTPRPYTYCEVVQQKSTQPEDNPLFGLPDIKIGWGSCVQFGGFFIPLGWINSIGEFVGGSWNVPDSWQVPGLNFCFKPVYFGTLTILNIDINLDYLASVMAGVLIIRLIMRS